MQGSKTLATVVRDDDFLRVGIAGHAQEVSACRLELLLESPVDIAEHVYVELENVIQRVRVRVRACVERVDECEDGLYRLACSLLTRLSPRDVQGLSIMKVQGSGDGLSVSDFLKRHLS
jgi:hypothetical protein